MRLVFFFQCLLILTPFIAANQYSNLDEFLRAYRSDVSRQASNATRLTELFGIYKSVIENLKSFLVKKRIENYEITSSEREHAVEIVQNLAVDFVDHVSRIADEGTDKRLIKTTLEYNVVITVSRFLERKDVTGNFLLKPPASLTENMLIAFIALKFYSEKYLKPDSVIHSYSLDEVKSYLKSFPYNPSSDLSSICNHFHKDSLDIGISEEMILKVRSQCHKMAMDVKANHIIYPKDNEKHVSPRSKVIYPIVWHKKIDQIFDNGKIRNLRQFQHQIIKDFFKYIYKLAPKADGFEEDKWPFYTDTQSTGDGILTTREIQYTLEYCFYRVDCYRAMLKFYREYDLDINSIERFVVKNLNSMVKKEIFVDYTKYLDDVPDFMESVVPVRDYFHYCPLLSIEKRDHFYETYEYLNYLVVFECIFKEFMQKVNRNSGIYNAMVCLFATVLAFIGLVFTFET
ncbi:hypothetical protein ROZALSC1DRAFT_30791, partial [Rozella allomycis CSF55]